MTEYQLHRRRNPSVRGAAPLGRSMLFRSGNTASYGQAWLLTFTDLVALMLAFFVLLFSMSQVEQRKWEGLVAAMTVQLDSVTEAETQKPAVAFQPEEKIDIPGADLDYLAPLLRQQIAAHPLLSEGVVRQRADRLVVSLPASLVFQGTDAAFTTRAREVSYALGGVLRNLRNRVELEARMERRGKVASTRADWRVALDRAVQFTNLLHRAGYRKPMAARAVVSGRGNGTTVRARVSSLQSDRLDIVIYELSAEVR